MVELELKDQIAALVASMREQTDRLDGKLDGISNEMASVKTTVTSLEEIKPALVELVHWKPKIDAAVGALQADLGTLRFAIDNLTNHAPPLPSPTAPGPSTGPRPELRVEVTRVPPGDEGRHGPAATASTTMLGVR